MTDEVAKLYDERAEVYDDHYRRRVDAAEDKVLYGWLRPFVDGRRVLDLGCGTGELAQHTNPAEYFGIDVSAGMLDKAAVKLGHPAGRYTAKDFNDWAEGDTSGFHRRTALLHGTLADHCDHLRSQGEFDCVSSLWAFPHFQDPFRTLRLSYELVKPGGWLFVQGFAPRYAQRPNYILNGHGSALLRPTTAGHMAAQVATAGWQVSEIRGFRWMLDEDWLERVPVGLLAAGMRLSSKLLDANEAATHIVIARKPTVLL